MIAPSTNTEVYWNYKDIPSNEYTYNASASGTAYGSVYNITLSPVGLDNVYRVDYDGYGGTSNGDGAAWSLTFDLKKDDSPVEITPINWNATDNTMIGNSKGEILSEDIKMNPYNSDSVYMQKRFNYLSSYFNNSSSLDFSCLPDLSITTGDIARVETNLYKNTEPATKDCLIVYMELKYSGTVKQTFKAHEMSDRG